MYSTNILFTFSSNFEYLSVSCRNKSEGGTFFSASFSAFTQSSTEMKLWSITTDIVQQKNFDYKFQQLFYQQVNI